VLKVFSDILYALDSQNLAMLTMLDLSATFDSVDPDTLLQCLHKSCGLQGRVLDWFTSYLSGRVQHVRLSEISSTPSEVIFGDLHRTDPVPSLHDRFTPVSETSSADTRTYADDTQIYGFCRPADSAVLSEKPSLTRSQHGWQLTGFNSTMVRPTSSGVPHHVGSIKFLLTLSAWATMMFYQFSLLMATAVTSSLLTLQLWWLGLPDARRSATVRFPWQLHVLGTVFHQPSGMCHHFCHFGAA